jgi:hypothetical protein
MRPKYLHNLHNFHHLIQIELKTKAKVEEEEVAARKWSYNLH